MLILIPHYCFKLALKINIKKFCKQPGAKLQDRSLERGFIITIVLITIVRFVKLDTHPVPSG